MKDTFKRKVGLLQIYFLIFVKNKRLNLIISKLKTNPDVSFTLGLNHDQELNSPEETFNRAALY